MDYISPRERRKETVVIWDTKRAATEQEFGVAWRGLNVDSKPSLAPDTRRGSREMGVGAGARLQQAQQSDCCGAIILA